MCYEKVYNSKKYAITRLNNPLIAKEDIVVYKILNQCGGHLTSPFQNFKYKKGVTYEVAKDIVRQNGTTWEKNGGEYTLEINDGLHSYAHKERALSRAEWYSEKRVYESIIPKGSYYWAIDDNGTIVSTALKVIKQIKK